MQVVSPLEHSPIGTFMEIAGLDGRFGEEYRVAAFIPDDLPESIDLPASTWQAIAHAMAAVSRLDAVSHLGPNPMFVARIDTRREALGTSALEGTFGELPELLTAEEQRGVAAARIEPRLREILNYAEAAELAYQTIRSRPISLSLLDELQAIIVRGGASDGADAGTLRRTPVFIGDPGRRISEARFVPPPPGPHLRGLCLRWVQWLSAEEPRRSIPLLGRIALAHYQFESIHPYLDGNGRIGRLVAILQMLEEGVLRSPVLSISSWLRHRDRDYRDHLLRVSESGDFAPWIEFIATAFDEEATMSLRRIESLLELRGHIVDRVKTELPRARLAVTIAEDLIAFPVLTVAAVERRYGKSNPATRAAVGSLAEIGVLEQMNDATYARVYGSREVLRLIEE